MASHTSNQWAIVEGVDTLISTPRWIHRWREIRFIVVGAGCAAVACIPLSLRQNQSSIVAGLIAGAIPLAIIGLIVAAMWLLSIPRRNRRIVLDLRNRTVSFENFRLDRGQFWPWSEPKHAELVSRFEDIRGVRGEIPHHRTRLQLHIQTDRGIIHVGGDMCYLEEILHTLSVNCRPQVCDECGYSLVGNTTGVCPECGTGSGRQGTHQVRQVV